MSLGEEILELFVEARSAAGPHGLLTHREWHGFSSSSFSLPQQDRCRKLGWSDQRGRQGQHALGTAARRVLTLEQRAAVAADPRPVQVVAEAYGVSQSTVCRCVRGKRYGKG